jgi:hypothetical protein
MFCLDVVVECRCVFSTDVFLWDPSCSCNYIVYVLLACMYMIAFSPCLCSLYVGVMLCLICGGCETVSVKPDYFNFNTDILHSCINP